jgi:hypothetical protein
MQDYRSYYGTNPTGGRRSYRKNPAYQAEIARRDALRLRAMIAEIEHSIMALERSIEAEQELAGVDDRHNLAYPMSARAMEARLENLKVTRAALVTRLSNLEQPAVSLEAMA